MGPQPSPLPWRPHDRSVHSRHSHSPGSTHGPAGSAQDRQHSTTAAPRGGRPHTYCHVGVTGVARRSVRSVDPLRSLLGANRLPPPPIDSTSTQHPCYAAQAAPGEMAKRQCSPPVYSDPGQNVIGQKGRLRPGQVGETWIGAPWIGAPWTGAGCSMGVSRPPNRSQPRLTNRGVILQEHERQQATSPTRP